ncbi:hypothetical protein HPB47_000708 [Ixodes persulcatus]|uniref:Uncharacterized protein n=1 Tax=Ixodes persulcatus TaxID=34615 RepID=A0AC60PRB4_IXOPE|nr:hypothetical protein HPB47_000708 [Ixodes persulcatus]
MLAATGSKSPVDSQLRHESVDKLLSILGDTSVANIFAGASKKEASESEDRFEAWERGEIDYMGADAFENIQAKLDEAIKASDASKGSSSCQNPSLSETDFCEIFGRS